MEFISDKVSRRRLMTTAGLIAGGAVITAAAPLHVSVDATGAAPASADEES